jgi:hypothetical protein
LASGWTVVERWLDPQALSPRVATTALAMIQPVIFFVFAP